MSQADTDNQPAEITLSIAVTAHAEGRLLRPTLRSIAAAMAVLVECSVRSELLIMLDNATDETLREAEHWLEPSLIAAPVRIVQVALGDSGASRNAAAQNARGLYLALCDGDDLVSKNYFVNALEMLSNSTESLVIHPASVISFGARSLVWKIPASESVDHLDLIRHNLWPSSSVSLRETYLDFPYPSATPEGGFGPEDWLWNIETSIAGVSHRPAPDTMFFYRVRRSGGVNNRHLHSILPPFDLEGLITALPLITQPVPESPSRPSSRDRVRTLAKLVYRLVRPAVRLVTAPLGQRTKEKLYAWAVRIYRPAKLLPPVPPTVVAALRDVSELEPAVSWTANGFAGLPVWAPRNDGYSSLLVSLVDQLRGRADAIVAVPWVGIGGADLVSLNYAKALAESATYRGKVSMLATYTPSNTHRHLIPENVNFVQIPEAFRTLSPNLQRKLLAQVFILLQPRLVLSVNCFDVTNSLQLYGNQLGSLSRVYLTLFAFDRIGAGYPTNPITDDSQRQYLDNIAGILTDNSVTASLLKEMLALGEQDVRVHHQPALTPLPPLRTGTRAYNNSFFSEANPFKLLWPHRIDKEKRPDALIEIAQRLRSEGLPVEIHIHGQQVLSSGGNALMKSLLAAGVTYNGPYQGGLMALPTHDYHALLLTSESEGLPLVLVQSMLLGLPVIATAVGGVTDIVRDKETGLLARDPDDVDGFVAAIRYLMESLEGRRRLIHSAYDFAASQHGWPTFTRLVNDTFG